MTDREILIDIVCNLMQAFDLAKHGANQEALKTTRCLALATYIAAMPEGKADLHGPEDFLAMMRSDWPALCDAWEEAGEPYVDDGLDLMS